MSAGEVRVRITRELTGSVDGIQLDRFSPGYVYVVGTTMANYLMAIGAGVPVADDSPALRLPPRNVMFGPQPVPDPALDAPVPTTERRRNYGVPTVPHAADRSARKKHR